MQCELCETVNPEDNLFCEGCGARIAEGEAPVRAPKPPIETCECGTPLSEMDEDGFCAGCGKRLRRPAADHIEIDLAPDFAGVSDRGLKHSRNEDRFAVVRTEGAQFLLVCDGVSMSPDADRASVAAVEAASKAFSQGAAFPQVIEEAVQSVVALGQRKNEAPSTTLVAALVEGGRVHLAWLGDSRAYWIKGSQADQLTRDHSWLNSQAAREASEDARNGANSHALTRWVGSDASDPKPETLERELAGPGMLLLCSDGLWNYVPDAGDLGTLVSGLAAARGATGLSIARGLVDFACSKGGHDNITAAVLRLPVEEKQSHGE